MLCCELILHHCQHSIYLSIRQAKPSQASSRAAMSTPTWPNHSEEYMHFALNPQNPLGYTVGEQNPNHPLGMMSDGSGNISLLFPIQQPMYVMHRLPMIQPEIQPAWCRAALLDSYISAGLLAPHSLLRACWAEVANPVNRVEPSDANMPATSGLDFLAPSSGETGVNNSTEPTDQQAIEVWHHGGISSPTVHKLLLENPPLSSILTILDECFFIVRCRHTWRLTQVI